MSDAWRGGLHDCAVFSFPAEYLAARGVAFADGNALVEFPAAFVGEKLARLFDYLVDHMGKVRYNRILCAGSDAVCGTCEP
jgi:hypothetical protein